jgi:hypothetical protein
MDPQGKELRELSQIVRQNCLVLRPHNAGSLQESALGAAILRELTAKKAAELLEVQDADIVELQRFRDDHVRIRLREPAAVQAAFENMKGDTSIFVGSDLPVSGRQLIFTATQALRDAGLDVRMAGSMVKYRTAGSGESWLYVNPRDLEAVDDIVAGQQQQQQRPQQQLLQGETAPEASLPSAGTTSQAKKRKQPDAKHGRLGKKAKKKQ